ncbi:DUF6440 family protein [Clostridium ihumii]|uniref:DUF6440 family protein n=1 Tax=Clostridium ihumii TaxID=1470356 RepID=UPI00054FBA12|nr:DUF6440 family protein [Clostridium ihumii]
MVNKKRFSVTEIEGMIESFRVIVDNKTGVNYLYVSNGTSGGLSVLFDSNGKPIVTNTKIDKK